MTELNTFFVGILSYLLLYPFLQGGLFGVGAWLYLSLGKQEKDFLQSFFGGVAVLGCGVPLACLMLYLMKYSVTTPLYWWAFGAFGSFILMFYLERSGFLNKAAKSMTKESDLVRDGRTDIRDLMKDRIKKAPEYNPENYFKSDDWFIGLDENKNPNYLGLVKLPHVQVNGFTGAGKSVLLGVFSGQAIEKGEAVFVFDPKADEWLPHVLKASADRKGTKYNYLNFRSEEEQLNVFDGTTVQERMEIFREGFDLAPTGTDADHYRAIGRDIAWFLSTSYEDGDTFLDLLIKHESYIKKAFEKPEGFLTKLREMSRVSSFNAKKSTVCLKTALENQEVVLFIGSIRSDEIKVALKMIFVRLCQLAENRGNFETPKQACFVIDELPFFLSKTFMDALVTIRDKGVHFLLAYQSVDSLLKVPKDLDPQSTKTDIQNNAYIHFSYRTDHLETAEFYSGKSGTILVDDEIRHVEKNLAFGEDLRANREIRQAERPFIDVNQILSLPDNCGLLTGAGLAKKLYISPLKVQKNVEAVEVKGSPSTGEPVLASSFDDL